MSEIFFTAHNDAVDAPKIGGVNSVSFELLDRTETPDMDIQDKRRTPTPDDDWRAVSDSLRAILASLLHDLSGYASLILAYFDAEGTEESRAEIHESTSEVASWLGKIAVESAKVINSVDMSGEDRVQVDRLPAVLGDISNFLEAVSLLKGVRVRFSFSDHEATGADDRYLPISAVELFAVMNNVVRNSIKSCVAKKQNQYGGSEMGVSYAPLVNAQAFLDDDAFRISVRDNGAGMSREQLQAFTSQVEAPVYPADTGGAIVLHNTIKKSGSGSVNVKALDEGGVGVDVVIPLARAV